MRDGAFIDVIQAQVGGGKMNALVRALVSALVRAPVNPFMEVFHLTLFPLIFKKAEAFHKRLVDFHFRRLPVGAKRLFKLFFEKIPHLFLKELFLRPAARKDRAADPAEEKHRHED